MIESYPLVHGCCLLVVAARAVVVAVVVVTIVAGAVVVDVVAVAAVGRERISYIGFLPGCNSSSLSP